MPKQQADWLKTWQENQEKLTKQYAGWGEEMMANMLGKNKKLPDFSKGWFTSHGDFEGQFREFGKSLNEMVNNAWGDKIPAEMLKFMNISFFEEFYKNWLSSLELPGGVKASPGMDGGWQQVTDFLHSFLDKNNSYFASFSNTKITDQMNRVFGMLQGALGQEESAISDILNGYQEFFGKMFESTTAQSTEKLAEVFDAWAKELEKNLSAPKLGINRELAHDMSQLLVLSQDYIQTYSKLARLIEATGRKAGVRFQTKLSEAALKNKPVDKFVDLCALWSVENEAVFTEVMGSQEFAKLQGDFVNAGHRLKIQCNKLAERALEPTPIALKRDLDLVIAEITQLKRDMRTLQREFREKGKEMRVAREAQAAAEEETKKTRIAAIAAEAAAQVVAKKAKAAEVAAQVEAKKAKTVEAAALLEAKKAKAAVAAVEVLTKRAKPDNKTVKAATTTRTKSKNVQ
jgi:class III poly(R)-hydroxyalkanoic acid synthase PhaE subunit